MREWKPVVRGKFFSIKELLASIFLFLCISIILFPKDKLEEYLFTEEKTNLELYITYMKNISRIKNDPVLRLFLANTLIQAGRLTEAQEIGFNLINSSHKDEAYLVLFRVEKFKHFSEKENNHRLMEDYLIKAIEATNRKDIVVEIYKEAISMNLTTAVMLSSDKLYRMEGDPKWLEEAYNYAIARGDFRSGIIYASELCNRNPEKKTSYINDIVYMIKNHKDNEELLEILRVNIDEKTYKNVLSQLTTFEEISVSAVSEKSLKEYIEIFKNTKNMSERKHLFEKIVGIYLTQGQHQDLKEFLLRYHAEFVKDKVLAVFMLKASLATGDTQFARTIAVSIKEANLK